ncbi:MAG: hypothetical protein ACJA01_001731 [Saprospiraceae bacterium]|jgi:hypothetical protein
MKYIINLLILGLIVFLGFALYNSIKEPIAFGAELNKRQGAVVTSLQNIRKAQEIHREIKGEFAGSFADLKLVLMYDSIPTIKLEADPTDPTNLDKFQRIVTYAPAIDEVNKLGLNLDDLAFVPFTDKKTRFEMQADTTTYQSTIVPVMEVMTKFKDFMGPFADPRYRKYEKSYDPDASIGFGSMNTPNLEGNWK